MKKLFLLLLLILPLAANSQGGNFRSGNKLKTECFSDSPVERGLCMGYVIGVADNNSFLICAPSGSGGVTVGQFRDIVKKYFDDNPAQLHKDADVLVLSALQQAFPCPKKK